MRNLLVPELRELLAEGDAEKMRELSEATHPALIADFLNGLTQQFSASRVVDVLFLLFLRKVHLQRLRNPFHEGW